MQVWESKKSTSFTQLQEVVYKASSYALKLNTQTLGHHYQAQVANCFVIKQQNKFHKQTLFQVKRWITMTSLINHTWTIDMHAWIMMVKKKKMLVWPLKTFFSLFFPKWSNNFSNSVIHNGRIQRKEGKQPTKPKLFDKNRSLCENLKCMYKSKNIIQFTLT